MNISAFSPASIWASVTRTLTGFGTVAFQIATNVNQSLAANSTVAFSTLAGRANSVTIGATADASGTVTIRFVDGTNIWTMQTIAAGTTSGQDIAFSATLVWMEIHNNSATVAAKFWACGFIMVQ